MSQGCLSVPQVNRQDITSELWRMGLKGGDRVMVHSSLSSMGKVKGGALVVVEAFLEVLGPEGTLMVPTFTHSATEYFDPQQSLSKNGAITEATRRYPGAVRSLHPTHAVTAIGPDADELVQDDLERGPLGAGLCPGSAGVEGGLVFLLGVDHKVNSTIYIGEDYAGDPDRHNKWNSENPKRVILNHPEHGEIEVLPTSMMGSIVAFEKLEEVLRDRRQILDGQIGAARCQLMKGQDVIDATVGILKPILLGQSATPNC